MSFTVTQRKRGGFEYTSVAETEAAALVLATMMRRAGDEYCREAAVTVMQRAAARSWQRGAEATTAGRRCRWRGRPPPKPGCSRWRRARAAARTPPTAKRKSGPFARMPTEPMASGSQVSIAHQSYASISITDYSAVSVA